MPIDYRRYPPNWKAIRSTILERAGHRCERCGLPNYAIGYRNWAGVFVPTPGCTPGQPVPQTKGAKFFRIILTVAHLDHDIANNQPSNLLALCQQCHLRHDAAHHAQNRRKKANP